MRRETVIAAALVLLAACGARDRGQVAVSDSLGRDLELAPVDSSAMLNDRPAPEPAPTNPPPAASPSRTPASTAQRPSQPVRETPPPRNDPAPQVSEPQAPARPNVAPAPLLLAPGTAMTAAMTDSITSRSNKPGETVTATIPSDVRDQNGRVIVPAGSTARFTITELAPAENKSAEDGTIALRLTGLTVRGHDYPISGSVQSVEHSLRGRGVTAGDAAKVGAGAAAGAIAGRVLGGKKGTVIGGVVGAAVGTGVAMETADRDVVVAPGAAIAFTLGKELVVSPR